MFFFYTSIFSHFWDYLFVVHCGWLMVDHCKQAMHCNWMARFLFLKFIMFIVGQWWAMWTFDRFWGSCMLGWFGYSSADQALSIEQGAIVFAMFAYISFTTIDFYSKDWDLSPKNPLRSLDSPWFLGLLRWPRTCACQDHECQLDQPEVSRREACPIGIHRHELVLVKAMNPSWTHQSLSGALQLFLECVDQEWCKWVEFYIYTYI